jgi:hypothetical protein
MGESMTPACIMCGVVGQRPHPRVWSSDYGYAVFLCESCYEKASNAHALDVLKAFDSDLPQSLKRGSELGAARLVALDHAAAAAVRSEGAGVPGTPVEPQAASSVDGCECGPVGCSPTCFTHKPSPP